MTDGFNRAPGSGLRGGFRVSADERALLETLREGVKRFKAGEVPMEAALGRTHCLVRDGVRAIFEAAEQEMVADAAKKAAFAAEYASWDPEKRADYDRAVANLKARRAADRGRVVATGPMSATGVAKGADESLVRPEFTPVESSGEVQLSDEERIKIARAWTTGDEVIDRSKVSLRVDRWRFVLNVNGRDIAPDDEALHKIIRKDAYEALGWEMMKAEEEDLSPLLAYIATIDSEVSRVLAGDIKINDGQYKMYKKGTSYIFDCRPGTGGVSCLQLKEGGKIGYARL